MKISYQGLSIKHPHQNIRPHPLDQFSDFSAISFLSVVFFFFLHFPFFIFKINFFICSFFWLFSFFLPLLLSFLILFFKNYFYVLSLLFHSFFLHTLLTFSLFLCLQFLTFTSSSQSFSLFLILYNLSFLSVVFIFPLSPPSLPFLLFLSLSYFLISSPLFLSFSFVFFFPSLSFLFHLLLLSLVSLSLCQSLSPSLRPHPSLHVLLLSVGLFCDVWSESQEDGCGIHYSASNKFRAVASIFMLTSDLYLRFTVGQCCASRGSSAPSVCIFTRPPRSTRVNHTMNY